MQIVNANGSGQGGAECFLRGRIFRFSKSLNGRAIDHTHHLTADMLMAGTDCEGLTRYAPPSKYETGKSLEACGSLVAAVIVQLVDGDSHGVGNGHGYSRVGHRATKGLLVG